MKKFSNGGEIVTILTIAIVIIIGAITAVSTVFLSKSNTSQTTKTFAMYTNEGGGRDTVPPPADTGSKDTPAPVAPASDTQKSEADQQRQVQQQHGQVTETQVPAQSPQGGGQTAQPTPTPFSGPLPGDAKNWKCPGPNCDKCGFAGWSGPGCQGFVAQHPSDVKYWNGRASGQLSACGGAEKQCTPGSTVQVGNTTYTCGNDGCIHESGIVSTVSSTAATQYEFDQKTFDACLQNDPQATPDSCRAKANIAITPAPNKVLDNLPFATFKTRGLCVNCEQGCESIGNGYWACTEDIAQYYPTIMEKTSCTSPDSVTKDKYGNYYQCSSGKWKSITSQEAMLSKGIYDNQDVCENKVKLDHTQGKASICVPNADKTQWQYMSETDYQYGLSFGQKVPLLTEDVCDTEVTVDGGVCVPAGTGADGLPYFRHITGTQQIQEFAAMGIFVNQDQCETQAEKVSREQGKATRCIQNPTSLLWQNISEMDYQAALQKQQAAAQKAYDDCTSDPNHDATKGTCIKKPDGSVAYVPFTDQQKNQVSGSNIPLLNIFGQSIGAGWLSCGGENQRVCFTSTAYIDRTVTTPSCGKGLMPNAVDLCVRDPEYSKSLAFSNYLQQNPNLTPEELQIMLQQNPDATKYLPYVSAMSQNNGSQCLYSSADNKYSCIKAADIIKYYANQDVNKGKSGELEGPCNSALGVLFKGCNSSNLTCNANGLGGTCQLTDTAMQIAAQQMANPNNLQGQQINLRYFSDSSKIAETLTNNSKFVANLACDSSNPQYVAGQVVQCTDTTNKYVRTLPIEAMQNPQYFTAAGTGCRSSGGFCANDAGTAGQSDCPGGFSCIHAQTGNVFYSGEFGSEKYQTQGLGKDCDKSLDNGNVGSCVKGLRCWNYTCRDVTQLAYDTNYAKGYWAVQAEKNPIGGIASGIMSSLNFDGMTNATNVQAQVFQDQMKKISQSSVANATTIYSDYYASLPSAVKGKVINLVSQEQSTKNTDPIIGGIGTFKNWLQERGTDTGLFVGAYSSTFSNPYVETGETWTNPNSSVEQRLLDLGRSVAATAMPVVDVVSIGGGALVEKTGSAAIKIGGESLIKKGAADIAEEGLIKGGWSILKDQGLKDGAMTIGKALPGYAVKIGGEGLATTAHAAITLTEVTSKPFESVIGLAAPLISIPLAPLHAPVAWTAKMVGNGIRGLGELGVPFVSKLTDSNIARSVTEDAVAAAVARGEVLTGSALKDAGDKALLAAQKQGYHGAEDAFRTAFEETAAHPPPQIINAAVKDVDAGLLQTVLTSGSGLRGDALDQFIKTQAEQRAAGAAEKVPEEMAKVKGALQIIDFAKKWGLNGNEEGVRAALTELASKDAPVLREQAEKIFTDNGIAAAKAQTAVSGLLFDQSPYVITAEDLLKGISKDTAKKISLVQDNAGFQDLLNKGGVDKPGDYHFPDPKNPNAQLTVNLTDTDISDLQNVLVKNGVISTRPIDTSFQQNLKYIFQNDPQLATKTFKDTDEVTKEIVNQIYNGNFSSDHIGVAKAYAESLVADNTVKIEKTGLSGIFSNVVDSTRGTLADTGNRIASVFNRSNKVNEALDSLNTLVDEYQNRLRNGTITQDEFNRLTSDTEIRRQLVDAGFNQKDTDKILQQYHGIQGQGAGGTNIHTPVMPPSNSVDIGRSDDGFFWNNVSRKQAKVESITDNTFKLTDVGSRNGTFIYDSSTNAFRQIQPGEIVKIGDKLRFGPDQVVTVTKSRGGGIYLVDNTFGKALEIKQPSGIGAIIDGIFPDKKISSLAKLKPGEIPNKAEVLTDIGSNYDSRFFHNGVADQQARIGFNKSSGFISVEDLGSGNTYVYNKLTGQYDVVLGKIDTLSEGDIIKLGNQQFIIGISPGKRVYLIDIATGQEKKIIDSSSGLGRINDVFFNKNQYIGDLKKYGETVLAGTNTISTDSINNAISAVRRTYRNVKIREPSGKLVDSSVPFEELSVPSSDQRSLSAFKAKLDEIDDCITFKCQTAVAENFDARAQRMFGKSLNTLTTEEKIFLAAESLSVQSIIPADVLLRVENLVNDDLNRLNQLAARSNPRFTPFRFEDVAPQAVGNRTIMWRAGPNSAGVLGLNSGVDDIIFNADSLANKSLQYQEHISTHEFIHSYQRMFKPYGYDVYHAYATYNEVFDEWLARRITNIPESEVHSISYDIGVQRLNKLIRDKHLSSSQIQRLEDTALNGDFTGLDQWLRQNGFGDLRSILGDTSDYHFYTKSAR